MIYISDKFGEEKQKKNHFTFSISPPANRAVYEMWKKMVQPHRSQMTI